MTARAWPSQWPKQGSGTRPPQQFKRALKRLRPCLFCHASVLPEPDPRLPLLRIHACEDCRNWVAMCVGWRAVVEIAGGSAGTRPRTWFRGTVAVKLPERRVTADNLPEWAKKT